MEEMVARGYIELDITNMRNSVASAVNELNKIDRAGSLAQSELNQLQAASTGVGGAFKQAAEKSRMLEQQISQARERTAVYRQEITNLNTIMSRSRTEQGELTGRIEASRTALQAAESRVQALSSAYTEAQREIAAVTTQYGRNSSECARVTEANRDAVDAYRSAIRSVDEQRNGLLQLETRYDALGLEIEGSGQSVMEFQADLNNTDASITRMSRELAEAQSRAVQFGTAMQGVGDRLTTVGNGMGNIGGKLSLAVTAPIVAAGTASLKFATDAETSFAKVGTIADETVLSYGKMKKEVTSASNDTGVAITDFNEALYSSMSAGVETGNAIGFTTDMVKLAKGGFTDAEKAVDVVTSTLNAYGLSADQATAISDKLITTQNLGKTTVDELASSLGKVIPTAKNVNVDIDNVSAAMATLTKNGIQTAEATTYYNSMLNELGKSGSVADEALREMSGVGFAQLVAEGKPTTEILQMLTDYAGQSGKSLSDMFGSAEAGKAALTIMKNGGSEYNEMLQAMQTSAGATQAAFEKMDATPAAMMQKELNKLKNASIDVGIELLPLVTQGVQAVGKLAASFSKLSPEQQKAIVMTAGIVAGIGPLLTATGLATSGVGSLTRGIGSMMEAMGRRAAMRTAEAGIQGVGSAAATAASARGVGGLSTAFASLASPVGIATAGVAALGVGIAVAMKKSSEAAQKADLEKRFGDVSLSMEEVEDVAKRLTTSDWTIKVDAVIEAREKVVEYEQELKTTIEDINRIEWKVSVGLELTDEEKNQYRDSLNNFINTSIKYIEQQHYTANVAIDAVLTPGGSAYKNLSEFTTKFYGETEAAMRKLGAELAEATNKALEDGILSEEEIGAIEEKRKQLQAYIDQIADAEYKAKMKKISLEAPTEGLDAKSFEAVQKEINKNVQDNLDRNEMAVTEVIANLNLQYPDGGADYEKLLKEVELDYQARNGEIVLQGMEVSFDTIDATFNTDKLAPKFRKELNSAFNKALSDTTAMGDSADWTRTWEGLAVQISAGSDKLDSAARKNLEKMLEQMQPQASDLRDIAKKHESAGQAVPKGVAKGLADIYELEAMAGNTEHMYQLLGMQMGNTPEFLNAIAKAKESGGYVPEEVAEGIKLATGKVYDESTKTWKVVGRAADDQMPQIKETMNACGITATDALVNSLSIKSPEVQQKAMDLLNQIGAGTALKQPEVQALLSAFGITASDSLIQAVAGKSPELQAQAISLLGELNNGVALKSPEIQQLMNLCGLDASSFLIQAIALKSPEVQAQAISLLTELQNADDAKRPEILNQLRDLGINVDTSISGGLDSNKEPVRSSATGVINTIDAATGLRIGQITPGFEGKLKGMATTGVGGMEKVTGKSDLSAPGMNDPDWTGAASKGWSGMQGFLDNNTLTSYIDVFTRNKGEKPGQKANGGFTSKEHLTWISEGDKPEVVIPLDSSKRSRATSLYEQTGRMLGISPQESAVRSDIMDSISSMKSVQNDEKIFNIDIKTPEINYDKLAKAIAGELRHAPIEPHISIEMEDGDVIIDKEIVGRKIAPVVSRINAKKL